MSALTCQWTDFLAIPCQQAPWPSRPMSCLKDNTCDPFQKYARGTLSLKGGEHGLNHVSEGGRSTLKAQQLMMELYPTSSLCSLQVQGQPRVLESSDRAWFMNLAWSLTHSRCSANAERMRAAPLVRI